MRTWTLALGLGLLAACSNTPKGTGTNITSGNSAPTIDSVELAPDPAYETSTLTCTAMGAADVDGDDIALAYEWEVNSAPIAATTETLDGTDFNKGDEVSCRITPSDLTQSGVPVTSNTVVILNSPPTAVEVTVDPSPATAADTLTATAAGFADADGDDENWEYAWFVNGSVVPGSVNTLAGAFAKGDQVYVVATPDDGEDLGDPVQSAVVNIINTPPTLATATVTPNTPTSQDVLICTGAGPDDLDGDPVSFIYQWYVDGVPAGTGTDQLSSPSFTKNNTVWCEITPNDGTDNGPTVTSNVVTVVNSAPTLTSVTLTPDPATETSTLTCSPNGMVDADGDAVVATFTWTVAGLPVAIGSSQLTGAFFDKGDAVQCTVSATDGTANSPQVQSNTVIIQNSPPSASTVGIVPTTPYTNDNLSASVTGWSDLDSDPEGYQYQWFKNGLAVSGAITSTFPAVNTTKNDIMAVQVTPWDGQDTGGPLMSADVIVQNSIPELTGATVGPASPLVSDTLTCTASGVSDGDNEAVTLEYQWYADGVPVGTNSDTLDAPEFGRGQFVKCEITPYDGQDRGTPVESNLVEVFNSLPTVTTVTLGPEPATESTILNCQATGTNDADGDAVVLHYSWAVAGIPLGETTQTLDGSFFDKNTAVQCFVTPDDGLTFGTTTNSNTVIIQNSAPSAASVAINPATLYTNTDASAVVSGWTDLDGDPEGYNYQWFKNGLPVGGATTQSYLSLNFTKGEILAVEATPNDGQATGTPLRSLDVVVQNSPPSLSTASVSPANPTVADVLTCSGSAPSDLDGDSVTMNYQWYADGLMVGTNSNTLSAPDFISGQEITCVITPNDGEDDGAPVTSNPVTVTNSEPTIGSVTLGPTPAVEATVLTCTANSVVDPDGGAVNLTYSWTVAGVAVPTATTDTLTGLDFDKGDAVQCTATPDDGVLTGTPVASNVVIIGNTAPSATIAAIQPAPITTVDTASVLVGGWDDVDGDPEGYRYQWYVNGGAVPGATTATLSSALYVKHDFLTVDVTPDDGTDLGTAVSAPALEVQNTPPILGAVTVTPAAPTISDTLTCTPSGATDADGDTVTYTYTWYVDGAVAGGGTSQISAPDFSSNQAVFCRVTPFDGEDAGNPVDSVPVSVGNSLPTIDSVTLGPTPAYEDTILTCTPNNVLDSDGDTVTLTYEWIVDGVSIPVSIDTLEGSQFDRSQTVQCYVTPNDGTGDGARTASNPVVISNSPPSITDVAITPGSPTTGDDLVAIPSGWADLDGDAPGYLYQWFIDGAAISGATSDSLASTRTTKGDVVTVRVTPTDGTDPGSPITSPGVVIENSAPSITTATVTPIDPVEADMLSCTPSGWSDPDGDSSGYVYAWYVNSTVVPTATTAVLTGADFDKGDEIWCVITPDDGTTTGTPVQSTSVFAQNSAPYVLTVSVNPTTATESTTLICSATASDDDPGDTPTVSYSWTVGGVDIGVSSNSLTGADFDKDEAVRCYATPNDGTIDGPAVGSNTVVVDNTAPTVSSVSIVPSSPTTVDDVSAVPIGWNDADGDTPGYIYQWYVNAVPVGGNTSTLASSFYNKDDSITVQVTPDDGSALGPNVLSSATIVANSPPTAPVVLVSPGTPDISDALICNISTGSTDADGDSVSYTYAWYRNGLDSGFTGSVLAAAETAQSEVWRCVATPFDGTDSGPTGYDEVNVIDATAPAAPVLDPLYEFSNDPATLVTGNAEPGSTVTVYATCDSGSSGTSATLADLVGDFSFVWAMNPGEYCSFYVDAVDASNNTSPPSNTVYTTICSVADPYEDATDYGDNSGNPIDVWGNLTEPSSASVTANILPNDTADWYLVHGIDDAIVNNIQGYNLYDVHIQLTAGTATYTMKVYKGSTATVECSTMTDGYDDYNDYWEDLGNAPDHGAPPDTNDCSNNSASRNTCEDMSTNYWVKVYRKTGVADSCDPYTLNISNAN